MPARRTTAALCAAALALLAGCTQASQPKADDPVVSAPPSSPPASSTPPASQSSPVSAPPSTSGPASTSSRPPAPSSTPAGPIDGAGGCPTAALKVAVLRASGAAGHQYAFLQFTNISATSCSLTGFPGVQLLRGGAPLGQPAARSALAASTVPIAPGAAVTARLVDDSTCQADNADSVQIFPPNRTDRIVLPISLRGCPLHVDPVTAS